VAENQARSYKIKTALMLHQLQSQGSRRANIDTGTAIGASSFVNDTKRIRNGQGFTGTSFNTIAATSAFAFIDNNGHEVFSLSIRFLL